MPLRSPTSTLLCSPPTPSSPSAAAPVSPRQRPTSVRRTCSSPPHRCPRQPVQRRRYFYPGSPSAGSLPRRNEGIPGAWAILFVRAVVVDPAGCNRPSPALGAVTVVFRRSKALDTRKDLPISWLHYPRPTRSRTYASPNPLPSPAQGSLPARAGSPLAGRVSHPLDDKTRFHEVIAYSTPPRPALPGRTKSMIERGNFTWHATQCSFRKESASTNSSRSTAPKTNASTRSVSMAMAQWVYVPSLWP